MVASGSRPRSFANSSLVTMIAPAPSFTPGALPAVVVPSGSKTGFREASFSSVVSRRGASSFEVADRDYLVGEEPVVDRVHRALLGAQRELVLLLARDSQLTRHERRLLDHVLAVEGGREPVGDHRVDQDAVPEPVSEPCLGEDVRRVRHRLHPARDDHLGVTGADHRIGDLDRANRRRANLVDRVRPELDRKPRADRRLARGAWPAPAWSTWPMIT